MESGFIKFLGTAGARFVTIKQLRSSGGIWLTYKNTNLIIDPGPGALVRCSSSRPKLDPGKLNAIALTHKHLDHSSDVNVMVEAMTEGGYKKRGKLFVPQDALGRDGVIFSYLESHPESIEILKESRFTIGDIDFEVAARNNHPVETYGIKFYLGKEVVSIISDTRYFPDLNRIYSDSTILVLNVVFFEPRDGFYHLSLDDARELIKKIKPPKTILTHFGMGMLRAKPREIEVKIREELSADIVCAYDGLKLDLPLN